MKNILWLIFSAVFFMFVFGGCASNSVPRTMVDYESAKVNPFLKGNSKEFQIKIIDKKETIFVETVYDGENYLPHYSKNKDISLTKRKSGEVVANYYKQFHAPEIVTSENVKNGVYFVVLKNSALVRVDENKLESIFTTSKVQIEEYKIGKLVRKSAYTINLDESLGNNHRKTRYAGMISSHIKLTKMERVEKIKQMIALSYHFALDKHRLKLSK